MRHMNRTDWSTRSPFLVNLVHSYHMQELWVKTAEQYKIIEQLVDPKSDTCACLTDIENNAVLYNLHMIAFCLRYPGFDSALQYHNSYAWIHKWYVHVLPVHVIFNVEFVGQISKWRLSKLFSEDQFGSLNRFISWEIPHVLYFR